jgi:hypothetical protein
LHGRRTITFPAHLGVYIRDLLYGTTFARPPMSGSDYASVSPLPKLLDKLILGIHNEIGIQSGEAMPLHGRVAGAGRGWRKGRVR